jgi:glucose repression regulatory protein TUP1
VVRKRVRASFNRHTSQINTVTFSPDGRSLVSAYSDRIVAIWNIQDGSSNTLADYGSQDFVPVTFSPDGRYIATGSFDNSVRIWDVRTHKLVARWKGHLSTVWCLEFTSDGKGLMSGSSDKTFRYWDVRSLGSHQERSEVIQGFPEIRCFTGHTVRFSCASSVIASV